MRGAQFFSLLCCIIFAVTNAQQRFPWPCSDVPCGYCTSPTVRQACPDGCATNCRPDATPRQTSPAVTTPPATIPTTSAPESQGTSTAPTPAGPTAATPSQNYAKHTTPNPKNKPYRTLSTDEKKDYIFYRCCREFIADVGCHPLCYYNVSLDELGDAFLNKPYACPLTNLNAYLYCASDEADNVDCCQRKGITDGKDACAEFCRAAPDIKVLGAQHFTCAQQLEGILQCHSATVEVYIVPPPARPGPRPTASPTAAPSGDGELTDAQADQKFLQCCKENIPEAGCYDLCHYGVTANELNQKLLVEKKCSLTYFNKFFYCASDGTDNRSCCRGAGIFSDSDRVCEPFCEAKPEIGTLGQQHFKCATQISTIMRCHRNGLKS